MIEILSVLIGVIIAFALTFFKDKFEEKRQLNTWKIVVLNELLDQKNKILAIKNAIKTFGEGFSFSFKFILEKEKIYNYDFANKVLGNDFSVYIDYVKKMKYIDLYIDELSIAEINNKEKPDVHVSMMDTLKNIDINGLDLIINKIEKSLGKNYAKK